MSGEFVDTNITCIHWVPPPVRRIYARELMARPWEDRTGAVSIQAFQEFYVTARRGVIGARTCRVIGQKIESVEIRNPFV